MGDRIDIKAALEKFRGHWIHEDSVLRIREMEERARDDIEEHLKTAPDDKLKESIGEYLSYLPNWDRAGINWVMDNNSTEKIKDAFLILFDDKKKESEKLEAILSLEGVGVKYASYLLDIAMKGNYIIYELTLIKALHDVKPGLLKKDFLEVRNQKDLEYFMEMCRKFYEKYGFTSYAEVSGFLYNGYVSQWKFEGF
jgi:hypothetical protein